MMDFRRNSAMLNSSITKAMPPDTEAVAEIDGKVPRRIDKKYLSLQVLGLEDLNPKILNIDESIRHTRTNIGILL